MCGIVASVTWNDGSREATDTTTYKFRHVQALLHRTNSARGPDAQSSRKFTLSKPGKVEVTCELYCSELLLRGTNPIIQPHINDAGDVLCWNGEIFDGLNMSVDENDGVRLLKELSSLTSLEDLVDVLGGVEGPYAFVYYHHGSGNLVFGRDPLGRRSLLIHTPTEDAPYFFLASASTGAHKDYNFTEVSTSSFYSLDLRGLSLSLNPSAHFRPNLITELPRTQSSNSISHYALPAPVNRNLDSIAPQDLSPRSLESIPSYLEQSVDGLIEHLERSVRLRVGNIPKTSITATLGKTNPQQARVGILFSGGIDSTVVAFLAHRCLPIDEPIDLLNVAFENPRKIQVQRKGNVNALSKKEIKKRERLARVTLEDNAEICEGQISDYMTPDRATGWHEVNELRETCPGRRWNFVEVNVPYEEYQSNKPVVEAVMWPSKTVMDLSLAMALYFASRGIGQVRDTITGTSCPYTSAARVLLNGLGSDELLGGYGRHRTAYVARGWKGVIDELQLEIDRIPTRNLGRDDRVISFNGKETRHPFLSLDVVSFLAKLPVHHKIDPRLEVGFGDKLLLRLAAHKLGLVEASTRKKRAMQFGSHSARMEVGSSRVGGDLLESKLPVAQFTPLAVT